MSSSTNSGKDYSAPSDGLLGRLGPQERIPYLVSSANVFAVNPKQPIHRYFRSGTEILRMAQVYLNEGHHENAFVMYMKYLTLFLEKIRDHPDFPSKRNEMKIINKRVKEEIMPTTEKLRLKLLERYKREYEEDLAARETQRLRELAKKEKESQDEAKGKLVNNIPTNSTRQAHSVSPAQLEILIDPSVQPTLPIPGLLDRVVYPNDFPSGGNKSQLPNSGLLLYDDDGSAKNSTPSNNDASSGVSKPPAFDRKQKPEYTRTDSLLAGSLRTVIVPQNTMEVFLKFAQSNTDKNVETCGILAGRLAQNQLFITHVIIPKQQGTADSCTTSNEEEIFDIQDQKNLITLGWIHTHPSQTAFLSSVDLHTHCSYQIMMPEAIAIVCAPKYQTAGFFILTPNYGLNYIAECRETGFHPHPNEPPLYMDAKHIQMKENSKIQVVDLRR